MAIKKRERQKRMNLTIPLPTWTLMLRECQRRSELAGGNITFSMLVVQVMNDLLGNHRKLEPGRVTTEPAELAM